MGMSRADFERLADALAAARPPADSAERVAWDKLKYAVSDACKHSSDRFNEELFIGACNLRHSTNGG